MGYEGFFMAEEGGKVGRGREAGLYMQLCGAARGKSQFKWVDDFVAEAYHAYICTRFACSPGREIGLLMQLCWAARGRRHARWYDEIAAEAYDVSICTRCAGAFAFFIDPVGCHPWAARCESSMTTVLTGLVMLPSRSRPRTYCPLHRQPAWH